MLTFSTIYLNYQSCKAENFLQSLPKVRRVLHQPDNIFTMVDENTMQQIWRLANELAVQQSANKETLNSITTQMSDVKVFEFIIER